MEERLEKQLAPAPVPRRLVPRQLRSRKRAGRPLTLTPDIVARAHYACAECGATLEQLAKILPATLFTLKNWMRYDREFRAAVRQGMDEYHSNRVEGSLLKRALGYSYDEVTEQDVEVFGKNPLGMNVKVPAHRVTTVHKVLPPDTGALIFYLTNRLPERWRQTYRTETATKTETNVEHNISVDLTKIPKEDLEILRNILRRVEPIAPAIADLQAGGRPARQNLLA
jgi:hypothetical protein